LGVFGLLSFKREGVLVADGDCGGKKEKKKKKKKKQEVMNE